jgi:hypothetical protein
MAKPRAKNKPNATGRSMTTRFARLDHRLLESSAYRALSPNARALLVEFTRMDNGSNNGALWLSVRDAAALMGVVNTKTASAAISELQDMGWIAMTKDAHFRVKAADTSRARCWRLTWLPLPKRQGPTNDYQECQPSTKLAARRMDRGLRALKSFKQQAAQNQNAVGELHTLPPFEVQNAVQTVGELHTAKSTTDGFPTKLIVCNLPTHTAAPLGGEQTAGFLGWWQHDQIGQLAAMAVIFEAAARRAQRRALPQ